MLFDTLGGLHGAGKDVVNAFFARCTASPSPGARPAAVGALRQGLSVHLGRSVARQLEALMILSTKTPAWWAATLPATPAFQLGGEVQYPGYCFRPISDNCSYLLPSYCPVLT